MYKCKTTQKQTFSCNHFGYPFRCCCCCFAFTLIESKRNGNEVAHKILANSSKTNKQISEGVELVASVEGGGGGGKLNKIATKQMQNFECNVEIKVVQMFVFIITRIISILF